MHLVVQLLATVTGRRAPHDTILKPPATHLCISISGCFATAAALLSPTLLMHHQLLLLPPSSQ